MTVVGFVKKTPWVQNAKQRAACLCQDTVAGFGSFIWNLYFKYFDLCMHHWMVGCSLHPQLIWKTWLWPPYILELKPCQSDFLVNFQCNLQIWTDLATWCVTCWLPCLSLLMSKDRQTCRLGKRQFSSIVLNMHQACMFCQVVTWMTVFWRNTHLSKQNIVGSLSLA